ncbi:MAG: hypothetical protein ABF289_16395 [Clostridiales bacterium]
MLFSELHCKYYTLVNTILNLSHNKSISLDTIRKCITDKGFLESVTCLVPPLVSQDCEGYHLLVKNKKGYQSILKNKPSIYTTNLELSWIKTLLQDSKINLFLDEEDYHNLCKTLLNVEPLFNIESFNYIRQDNSIKFGQNKNYEKKFKKLTYALQNNEQLELNIDNTSPIIIIPYKMEYDIKEDNFNLLSILLDGEKLSSIQLISITKINAITFKGAAPNRNLINTFVKKYKLKEPIHFELSNMRSGFERVFMQLSPYDRLTEFY